MRYNYKKSFFVILLVISMFNFINAAAPVTTVQNFPEGYFVQVHPIKEYFKAGEDVNFHIHVFNSSNGYPVNDSIQCIIHLYKKNGSQFVSEYSTFPDDSFDYEINVLGGNFTEDLKSYHAFCFSGELGGDYENEITVTQSGDAPNTLKLISYIVLLILIFGIALLIKSQHNKTDFDSFEKSIISSNKHTGETFVKSLMAGLFKNSFIWLYFIGWIMVMIIKEIIYDYGSVDVYGYFVLMANIYSLGLFLVVVYMIGFMIQYLKNIYSMISDDNWGLRR